jgi:DNA polymerase (family 10)
MGLKNKIKGNVKLSLKDSAYEYVDYIIASVHSTFHQDSKQMTQRILKALFHKKVKILAHPTGRLIGKMEGINANWEKIFHFI